jgi:nucleoside-diphosphate-sugar epimerase
MSNNLTKKPIVLVTGASGFIGRYCVDFLIAKNYQVHAIYNSHAIYHNNQSIWHKCNILNIQETRSLIKQIRPTHLLHLAWITEHNTYWESQLNSAWYIASLELIRLFQQNGGIRLVVAGTCAEYSPNLSNCCEDEKNNHPGTLYGQYKLKLHQDLLGWNNQHNVSFAWCRIFNLFGPSEKPSRLVPALILSLLKNNTFDVKYPSLTRDFLYVEDVANAFVEILDSNLQGSLNISAGWHFSLQQLTQIIANQIGCSNLLRFSTDNNLAHQLNIVSSPGRLLRELNWLPKFSLDEAVKKSIDYWKSTIMS